MKLRLNQLCAAGILIVLLVVGVACGDRTSSPGVRPPTPTTTVIPTTLPIAGAITATCPPVASGTVPVNIALDGPTQPFVTTLTTNVATVHDLVPLDGALPKATWDALRQWNPPLVRLHFGFYGDDSLPEKQQGVWDFTLLDAAISELRAQHITFYLGVRTAPPWMFDGVGQLRDQSFREYADYMARLVGWYNKGGFTDEAGRFHSSGHQGWIPAWEIWNEPNSGFEIPANVPNRPATWMNPDRFARLYDTVVVAMHGVDPTVQTGGPTISSYPDIPYLRTFVQNVRQPLNFLTLHYYAIGDPAAPDSAIFAAATGPRFLDRLVAAQQILASVKPGQKIPIWVDEVGVNEVSHPPIDPRGTSPLAYAFTAQVFSLAAAHGVASLVQFPLVGNAQLGLIDEQTFQLYRTYWFFVLLARTFPAGGTLLPITTPPGSGIIGVAEVTPDGKSLRVVLGNTRVAQPNDVNGVGLPLALQLTLTGKRDGMAPRAGVALTAWHFDASAPANAMPTPCFGIINTANATASMSLVLGGYGAAILNVPLISPP